MSDRIAISKTLRRFFESEEHNTRQAITQGDLDPGFPLTLSTALDSLRQAPEDVQVAWMSSRDGWDDIDQEDPADVEEALLEMFATLLEFANLIDLYGGDTSLMEWLR